MASYNTVPAEDTRLQEAAKSWKLKKIVVVSAALSFSLGACAATALSYREVGASRATQLVAQTDCQAKYPNLCSDDGCNCRCPPWAPASMNSGAKIEAGSCPGGIVRPAGASISDDGQIICAGQVRVGA